MPSSASSSNSSPSSEQYGDGVLDGACVPRRLARQSCSGCSGACRQENSLPLWQGEDRQLRVVGRGEAGGKDSAKKEKDTHSFLDAYSPKASRV